MNLATVLLMGLEGLGAVGLAAWAWQRGQQAGRGEGYEEGWADRDGEAQERWSGPGIAVEVSPPLDADPDTAEFLGWAAELRERSQDWEPPAEAEVVALADPGEDARTWRQRAEARLGLGGGWGTEEWTRRMPWEEAEAA